MANTIVVRVLLYEYKSAEDYLRDSERWTKEINTNRVKMSTTSLIKIEPEEKEKNNG